MAATREVPEGTSSAWEDISWRYCVDAMVKANSKGNFITGEKGYFSALFSAAPATVYAAMREATEGLES